MCGSQEELVFTSPVGFFPEVRCGGWWDFEAPRLLSPSPLRPRMAVIGWQKLEQVLGSSSCGVSWGGLPSLLGRAERSLPTGITAQ